ncbi:MAG: META domain-containing protein [Chloroflexota bacterium]
MRRSVLIAMTLVATLSSVVACTAASGSPLTGMTWQLTAVTEKVPAFQGVIPAADQPRYTIAFNTDGTYTGQADCNAMSGKYTTSGSNTIAIEAGAMTLMACADPESFGSIYAHALTTATTWAVSGNELTLSRADGATLEFAAGTGAAAASAAVASAAPPASSTATDLIGVEWQLSGITEKVPAFQGAVPPAEQPNYTIAFSEDGTFSAKADCNQVSGSFATGDGNALTITPGPSTRAMCPEGSLADLYIIGLGNAASYEVSDAGLTITLDNGGTLQFVKGV